MQTEVPGLLVAGEAVGGANGANRLSGNAITEALVFGRQAGPQRRGARQGRCAQRRSACQPRARDARSARARRRRRTRPTPPRWCRACKPTMADDVGPLRTEAKARARARAHRRADGDARRPAVRRRRRLRPAAAGMVRPAQHAAGRARGRASRAGAHRKPRRASARGFPRDAAAVARQPGRSACAGATLDIAQIARVAAEVAAQ